MSYTFLKNLPSLVQENEMRIRINNTAKWKYDFQYTNAGEISEMSVFIKISS